MVNLTTYNLVETIINYIRNSSYMIMVKQIYVRITQAQNNWRLFSWLNPKTTLNRPDKLGMEDLHQLEIVTGLCQPTCTKPLMQLFDASDWVILEAPKANLDLRHWGRRWRRCYIVRISCSHMVRKGHYHCHQWKLLFDHQQNKDEQELMQPAFE